MLSRTSILLTVAGIPLAAFVMYKALGFLIYTCAPDLLDAYKGWSHVAQLLWVMLLAAVLNVCNRLRDYCVASCTDFLGSPLPRWFGRLYLYSALCWLIATGRLLFILWRIPAEYSFDSVVQLLFLSCGISVMMGVAVPFCAGRLGTVFWYERWWRKLRG
ncbi:MAG: hypothetical protein V4539_19120 [Bacteroidota bacterium]